mgnify:CR=1 FL=1
MRAARMTAVLVCKAGRFVGILTCKDVMSRVVAKGLDPAALLGGPRTALLCLVRSARAEDKEAAIAAIPAIPEAKATEEPPSRPPTPKDRPWSWRPCCAALCR